MGRYKLQFIIFILGLIFVTTLPAQYSPGIKWKIIKTKHFEIIYPKELKHDAQRIANTMEYIYEPIGKTLKSNPGRYQILLVNTTTTPNGFVRSAPKESVWYHLPPIGYNMGSGEWFNTLATHETRHMVQFTKANIGFSRLMYILFGEIGLSAMTVASMPRWFEEGDAVTTETALTDWGRGRLPDFNKELRSILIENKSYSYHQMANSTFSYGNYYPNIYKMGFYLVAFARNTYDAEVWSRIINRTSYLPFFPLIFNISTFFETGKSISAIYNDCMDYLRDYWRKKLKETTLTSANIITNTKKGNYTNYINILVKDKNSLLTLKFGMDTPLTLVELKTNLHSSGIPQSDYVTKPIENKLFEIAALDHSISYGANILVWAEKFSDPLWENINYADIIAYDITDKKRYRLTTKQHLFVPSISPSGTKIAALEYTPNRKASMVIFKLNRDAKGSFTLLKTFRLQGERDEIFGKASWSQDGNTIVFVRKNLNGITIATLNLKSGKAKQLLPYSWHDIRNPLFYKNYVLYQASYTGIDNIFAIDTNTNVVYQVTSRKYGAQFPAIYIDNSKTKQNVPESNKSALIFSDYSAVGFNIAIAPLNSKEFTHFKIPENYNNFPLVTSIVKQETGKNILKETLISKKEYPQEDYNPFLHLINIHSWGIYPLPTNSGISIGGFLLSNDTMGVMDTSPWLNYNITENTLSGGIDLTFRGTIPYISLDQAVYQQFSNTQSGTRSWLTDITTLNLILPINLSSSIWERKLNLSTGIGFQGIFNYQSDIPGDSSPDSIVPINADISFYNHFPRSRRDMYPPWGEDIYIATTLNPFNIQNSPALMRVLTGVRFYLPGLFNHNSLKTTLLYLNQQDSSYNIFDTSNIITYSTRTYPRGYPLINRQNLFLISIDYGFPIFYPDFAIGPFLYISRIRGNIFIDSGMIPNFVTFPSVENYTSTGLELTMDFVPLMLPLSLNMGARLVYRITDNNFRVEDTMFSLGVNF